MMTNDSEDEDASAIQSAHSSEPSKRNHFMPLPNEVVANIASRMVARPACILSLKQPPPLAPAHARINAVPPDNTDQIRRHCKRGLLVLRLNFEEDGKRG